MATRYKMKIDHYELIAQSATGITINGSTINVPFIIPVLSKEISSSSDTSLSRNTLDITGSVSSVSIVCFEKSGARMDPSGDLYKITGQRFTNAFSQLTYTISNQYFKDPVSFRIVCKEERDQKIFTYMYKEGATGSVTVPYLVKTLNFSNSISDTSFMTTVSSLTYSYYSIIPYKIINDEIVHYLYVSTHFDNETPYINYLTHNIFGSTYVDVNIDGDSVRVRSHSLCMNGSVLKIQDQGQSGGANTNGGTSGSREPYQYPSYGGSDGINIIGGNGTHKFFKESSIPVNGNNIVSNLTDEENGDISSIFTNAHTSGTGGIRIYDLDSTKIEQLYGKIWDDNAADAISKYFAGNIGNTILRIYKIMVAPETMGTRNIYLGKYDTGISSDVCKQYKHMNLGTLQLPEYYGSFLDYQSKLMVFLPFSGWHDLMPDKYISPTNAPSTITVYLDVDFLAGIGTYNLMVTMQDGQVIIDNFNADFASDIPITSSQMSSAMNGLSSILSGAVALGAGAATLASGGLTIPQTIAAVSGIAGGATAAGLGMANIGRSTYNEQGGAGRNYGFLQPYNIYFMLFRPVQTVAENEVYYNGYQSRKTVTIENLENDSFSKMLSIRLPDSIPSDVKEDIVNIMTSRGFYK